MISGCILIAGMAMIPALDMTTQTKVMVNVEKITAIGEETNGRSVIFAHGNKFIADYTIQELISSMESCPDH